MSGWSKRCNLARAFLWEYSYKRLKLAQLLNQLGVFLTCGAGALKVLIRHVWVRRRRLGTGRTTEHPAEPGGQSKDWRTGAAASHACPGVRTHRDVSPCMDTEAHGAIGEDIE